MTALPPKFKYIGRSTPPNDWPARTSGAARYTADLPFEGLLVARVLRSPHPHAEIRSIDTTRAAAMPGVHAVITAADFPAKARYLHEGGADRPPLSEGKVRYVGEEVAAVAAETLAQAQAAVEAIRVEYRPLPAPLSVAAALSPRATALHERPTGRRNVSKALVRRWGDPDGAKARADLHVSGRFLFGRQTHASMEPNSVVASWDAAAGKMHIWASTQSPLYVRDEVAHVLGLAPEQVVCHEVCVGGGFGSKSRISEHEALAAALSRKARRPVRLVLDRNEEFETTKSRHPFHVDMTLHAARTGHVAGIEGVVRVENGGYDHSGYSVMSAGMKGAGLIYRPDGIALDGDLVDTATLPGGQFRGYGTTQVSFAIECLIDDLAHRLGQDPIALRIANANRAGETTLIGAHPETVKLEACLDLVRRELGWEALKAERRPGRGVGVAAGAHLSGSFADRGEANRSDAAIDIDTNGRIRVRSGTADAGTNQRTLLAQIAAETFDVPVAAIDVMTMDTDATTYDVGAWSSRGTHYACHAVKLAAETAAERLKAVAAAKFGDAPIAFNDGHAVAEGGRLSLAELVVLSNAAQDGVLTIETKFVEPSVTRPDPKTGVGNVSPSYCYAAHAASVEVDTRTGEVRILDYVAAHDVGMPLNPVAVHGQIVGAAAMGIGAALREELVIERGKIANGAYLHYALPRAADLPPIRSFTVENADPRGPFGAKAVGELGINPPPAAIANAVFDAVGLRITELPLTPDKILTALAAKAGRRRRFNIWRRPDRWWIGLVRWAYPRGLFALLHRFRTHRPSRRVPSAELQIFRPTSLASAYAQLGETAAAMGGGTDVMPRRGQRLAPDTLVSLQAIPELRAIRHESDGTVVLGSAVTLSALETAGLPLLAAAAATIASPQIRNMATVGGNLAQAKRCWFFRSGFECYKRVGASAPCYAILGDHRFYHAAIDGHRCQAVTPSDLATALLALDAEVEIGGPQGTRRVAIGDFYTGPGETVLAADELILSVRARQDRAQRGAFEKLRLWEGDFAVVSVAMVAGLDGQGRWTDLRIACGGIAPVPWRARGTERALVGHIASPQGLRAALDRELNAAAHPLARNGWKLDALAGLCERAAERLLQSPSMLQS
ncbi:MAG: molybdopterin-dependent oxidoreductase [Rhodospirillaceae bacterium]|nr:molybdopterin-dependent oxidoreductase [Rhodospirillaceae bacterium]